MLKTPNIYLAVCCLFASGGAGYWWLIQYSGWGEHGASVVTQGESGSEFEPIEIVEASGPKALVEVTVPLLLDEASTPEGMDENEEFVRSDRFPNESSVRDILGQLQGEVTGDTLSATAYEAYLLDLEELFRESAPHYAEMWMLIQSELGSDFLATVGDLEKAEGVLADIERKFGLIWGQTEPGQSLNFARQAGPHVLSGWLAGQLLVENDPTALLAAQNLVPPAEVYWEALLEAAEVDTILSLDSILENHMDEMTLEKWKEILFSDGNSDESVLAAWFEENINKLSSYPDFDEIEVIRMLRRYDYGEGPFMLTADVERVDAAKATKNYLQVAQLLEELSLAYDGSIDVSIAGSFALDWSKQDFAAASDWMLQNSEKISDSESVESMWGTMYRHKAQKDPEVALRYGLQVEDEVLRALALSNTLIPQLETQGGEISTDWVSELEPGFAKQRTMAGYVLGLSRHTQEATLEAQVKFQFLQDEYDLGAIQDAVIHSDLSAEDKAAVVELFDSY